MKPPSRATHLSALLSGVALGVGLPAIQALGVALGANQQIQTVIFMVGLLALFFGPVMLFVVGTDHLSIKSQEMLKKVYWSSLGQVGLRSLAWLVGSGIGFGRLTAMNGTVS